MTPADTAADEPGLPLLGPLGAADIVELARRGLLIHAAEHAACHETDPRRLSEQILAADPDDASMGHHERAVVRREIELASRVLDPPDEHVGTDETAPCDLSIVVPAHDVGPWIAQTLESLADQTMRLDVIVVIDHCGDETAQIVRAAEQAGALRVVESRLPGGAHARNLGAALARAPRLAFCDGDDLVAPGAHRSLVEASKRSGAPLTIGSFLKFRPDHTWSPARRHTAYQHSATYDGIEQAPTLMFHRACWNKVFRTDWWREHDLVFPEVPRSNDIVPMTQAYLAAEPISVIEDFVYLYRERPGQSSMSSQVGTDTSLRSYLEQEIECARLVLAHADAGVRREYTHTVLQEDAWIQVGRYLRQCTLEDRPPRTDVLDLCRHLVQLFDETLVRRMPLSARLTFAASARGADELAQLAASTDDREPATTRAEGWAGVLELGVPDDPLFPPPHDVWRFGVLPTLDDLLDDDSLPVEDTRRAIARLRRALDADPAWPSWRPQTDDVVRQALDRATDPDLLARHVEMLRAARVRVEQVERHGAARLRVVGARPGRGHLSAVHLLSPDADHSVREVANAPTRWSADLDTTSLPIGRLRLAATLQDEGTDLQVLTHLRHRLEPLPDPRPSDRLRVRPDVGPANLVVEHRHRLLRRVLQQVRHSAFRRS